MGILGFLIVIGSIFLGFTHSGGKILSLWQPYEVLVIVGSAFGAFVVANPFKVVKTAIISGIAAVLGAKKSKSAYLELFSLLFQIGMQVKKNGLMSIEDDLDNPGNSAIFSKYPNIIKQEKILTFIIDNLRLVVAGNLSSHELESLLDTEIETIEEEMLKPVHAVASVADALPGFGIVAAVLGIVITMKYVGGDPKMLGGHIAAALVGTFLGILFSYGFVSPIATSMEYKVKKEMKFYQCIKIFMLAFISGTAPQIAVEYARRTLYSDVKPTFVELENYVKSVKNEQ